MNSTILMFEQLESRILLSGSPMPEGQCEVPAVEVSVEANQSSEQQQLVNEIVIIDSKVKDYQSIIDSLQKNVEIYIVDSTSDGIKKITSILEDRQGIEALHIISHGSNGQVHLGNTYLNNDNLDTYQEEFRSWKNSLTESADILIYGCNVGQNTSFLESLSYLTDADIAASDDLTGAAGLGGDWILEKTTGTIETDIVISDDTRSHYKYILDETFDFDSLPSQVGSPQTSLTITENGEDLNITSVGDSLLAYVSDGGGTALSGTESLLAGGLGSGVTSITFQVNSGDLFNISSITLNNEGSAQNLDISSNLGSITTNEDIGDG